MAWSHTLEKHFLKVIGTIKQISIVEKAPDDAYTSIGQKFRTLGFMLYRLPEIFINAPIGGCTEITLLKLFLFFFPFQVSSKIMELARKQRMNTDIRRSIFCVLMTSEDFMDAFEKLLK